MPPSNGESARRGEALRERGAHRLGAIAIVIGTGTHRKPVVARGEALEPAIAVDHPPGENVAELAIIEHQVEITARAIGDLRVALRDIAGKGPALYAQFADEPPRPHAEAHI